MKKRGVKWRIARLGFVLALAGGFLLSGGLLLWAATWQLPDLGSFESRKVAESTKIYDRSGEVLLFDIHRDVKRTIVPYTEISRNAKNATVAIEDAAFWRHRGIRPKAFLRALFINIGKGEFSQGGSTITQQVVKNSLLTSEKKISRKLKEWVLAWRLDQALSKEAILALYLNEAPYGGNIYGIEDAAQTFFGKSARELSVAEAAYLAALPNAPTYFSPYGNNRDKLEERKNLVLERMYENGFLPSEELAEARAEEVVFLPQADAGIKAPHFVFYVRQFLEERYGKQAVAERGLKVITTLDFELQAKGEEIVRRVALENVEKFDAENAALVAIDPRSGDILAMVGSRGYFDEDIDGNFNAALGLRQPGSAFKPFVYAEALRKGFLPETVVFDLSTEFSTECTPESEPLIPGNEDRCYRPVNYDEKVRGPVTFREALAQSINIPAIKVLYLAGLRDSLRLAKEMGLSTLMDIERYGLTLVLGGGEVTLLELTSAYGVFAHEGQRLAPRAILRIEDKSGAVVEDFSRRPVRVLDEEIARAIADVLSDNEARTPAFGPRSPLFFPGRSVAAKTGTTNDFRDAWIVGFTKNLSVGAWAGNNNNRPMQKKVASFIIAPLWHEFMETALARFPAEQFTPPRPESHSSLPPIMRGVWQGGKTYTVDKISGKLATEFTPFHTREERVVREVHSILYWIDKGNPREPRRTPPETDPQFVFWEAPVRAWAQAAGLSDETEDVIPKETDPLHRPDIAPELSLLSPAAGSSFNENESIRATVSASSTFPLTRVNFFVDNVFVGGASRAPWVFSFFARDVGLGAGTHTLKAVGVDAVENEAAATVAFRVTE